ncbi:MAG TPA: citryl-CoA lyase [Persephonella sp.]|uniref:citrate synthase (unknown stereospecificity) n=1 Tax=Persephonella marina (strain DSM 14350 / EX-H1) TaxID=123214 RepID=C0QQ80_PERMH|nr:MULTISPECIES: citryl-CoA lyase [Persephonella]ACO04700.1 citrate synthase [Persephonella marina EX-H1]HCB69567.1 citryl-CoA lyase [Persephonella sp.]
MEKKWRTAISWHFDHEAYVRGYKLADLIGTLSFTEAIFLVLKGELPSEREKRVLDSIFVSLVEHSIAPPSVIAARAVASGGNSLHVGVGAGILAFGEAHGGALEGAMRFLQENAEKDPETVVNEFFKEGKRIPGYGHRYYKKYDPRSLKIMEIAEREGFYGKYCEFAGKVEKIIEKIKGKKLVLNVDGAIAAVVSEMGFDWRLGKGFFIIGRTAGLVAHVYEELTMEKPFSKRLDEEKEVEYLGLSPRELPERFRKRD